MNDEFYKDKYFEQLDNRLNEFEKKLDDVRTKVTWIYAWAAGIGGLAAFLMNSIFK